MDLVLDSAHDAGVEKSIHCTPAEHYNTRVRRPQAGAIRHK